MVTNKNQHLPPVCAQDATKEDRLIACYRRLPQHHKKPEVFGKELLAAEKSTDQLNHKWPNARCLKHVVSRLAMSDEKHVHA